MGFCTAKALNMYVFISSELLTAKQESWEQELDLKRPALPSSTCVISWTARPHLRHPFSKCSLNVF